MKMPCTYSPPELRKPCNITHILKLDFERRPFRIISRTSASETGYSDIRVDEEQYGQGRLFGG